MRSIRKFALLGVAAFLMCAAVASSASAVTNVYLGTASSHNATTAPSGTALSGSLVSSNTQLASTNLGTVTCTSSSLAGTVGASGGTSVTGTITSASFGSCTTSSGGGSCTVWTNGPSNSNTGLSWSSTVTSTGNNGTTGPSGSWSSTVPSSTPVKITCTVFFFPVTCNFSGTVSGGNVYNPNQTNRPWSPSHGGVSFSSAGTLHSSDCNENSTWSGQYTITSGSNEVWVTSN